MGEFAMGKTNSTYVQTARDNSKIPYAHMNHLFFLSAPLSGILAHCPNVRHSTLRVREGDILLGRHWPFCLLESGGNQGSGLELARECVIRGRETSMGQ